MERLTEREKGIAYYPHCFREDTCDGMGPDTTCEGCDFSISVCERLASYEDIGLTPEQLREVDSLYQEKCEEVAKLKEQLAAVQKESVTYEENEILNNDFCEWKLVDTSKDKMPYIKYETNCGFKYVGIWCREPFCPRCGKKIKGVG